MKNLFWLVSFVCIPFFLSAQTTQPSALSPSHEIAGEYLGTFARNGVVQENVLILVSPKNDHTVKITARSGAKMKPFTATLEDSSLSALRRLSLTTDSKVKIKEAMVIPDNGRLFFAISQKNGTLDAFAGLKVSKSN